MKKLLLSAFLILGGAFGSAHAYVNLEPVSYRGSIIVAHGTNPGSSYLRCNLMETGVDGWGRKFSNVVGTWDFSPYQVRVFNIPNNTNYFSFYCVPY